MFNVSGAASTVGGLANALAPVPSPRPKPTTSPESSSWGSNYLQGTASWTCTLDEALIANSRVREFRQQAPGLGTALSMVLSAVSGASSRRRK